MRHATILIMMTCIGLRELPSAFAQAAPQASQTGRPAIDGGDFPPTPGFREAGARILPDQPGELVELPPTQRPPAETDINQSGYVEPYPYELLPDWIELEDGGRVGAIEFRSIDAFALRLRLAGPFGDGLLLRVYDPASGSAFGPFRTPHLDDDGGWWTTIIFGDTIGLEFHVPPGAALPAALPLVESVACYYEGPEPGTADGCALLDVACYSEWRSSEALAVCMLAWVDGGVAGFCSGALFNRSPADGAPLVMTANHCLGNQTRANDAAYVWRYQNSTCAGTPPNPNNLARSEGSLLLRAHTDSDWNLVGLYEPPAESRYLGWDSSFWISFADCTGIHHPSGTHKRISFGENTGALYGQFCDQQGQNCFWAHTWGVAWDSGTIRPGSSGSPIMDVNRRVRGTLTGSLSDCNAYYGRFAMAYDDLAPFINNMASPVYVDFAWRGFERGSSAEPFNAVYEASFCARQGDTIRIRAGTYRDRCTIWRPMKLTSTGGLVRIGQ